MDPRRNQHQLFACNRLSPDSFLTIPHLFEKCKPFFKIFQKNFSGPAGPKDTARTRHRKRPLPPTPNAGRLSSSRRKFRTPKARGAGRLRRRRKNKTAARLGDCFLCWRTPIFPGRHQPSIFGTNELNFRVRDGNGWTLVVINTNYLFVSGSPDSFYILPRLCANCKHFLRDFFKIPKNHKIWELLSPSSTAFCGKNLTSRRCPPAAWPPSPSAVGRGTVFPGPG